MSSHFLLFTNIRQSMWNFANGVCLKLLWWPPKPWNHHFHIMFDTISTTQTTFPHQRKCMKNYQDVPKWIQNGATGVPNGATGDPKWSNKGPKLITKSGYFGNTFLPGPLSPDTKRIVLKNNKIKREERRREEKEETH